MIRAIFIFVVFGAIIFAANWLMDNNGTIAISWQGLDINESVAWGVAIGGATGADHRGRYLAAGIGASCALENRGSPKPIPP